MPNSHDTPMTLQTTMSPLSVAAILNDPGVCAVARDTSMRQLWCNEEYARNMGSTPEALKGTLLSATMTEEQAEERISSMRHVLEDGTMHAHQQVWVGARWLTRVWPLDPSYFGVEGYFILITRMSASQHPDLGEVVFLKTNDLGKFDVLSPRELEVMYYIAGGLSVSDVAKAIYRSEKTVGHHVESIYKKMGYTNRAALVHDAVESGLVSFTGDQWTRIVDPNDPER
jgi:DNA-binding CsgD family transcriptional regulator